ncbi:hypothetical protein, partial [Alistipes putredinis]|uniref:hypothetical protein n=1 Tax=Alistipes putredinis TaxID=28117 RepID=UPI0026721842
YCQGRLGPGKFNELLHNMASFLISIFVIDHSVYIPKTIDRFCVVTVTPRILNDPATRFPAVFRPESYFLNLPRRRNTVPERLPLFECRKIP